jgi:hypothetical protein
MRNAHLLLLSTLAACATAGEPEARRPPQQNSEASAASSRQTAEVTPAVARRAEEILRENAEAPVGTEIPFVLEGSKYVARIEEHENSEGDPERPPGRHKGVTVYVDR